MCINITAMDSQKFLHLLGSTVVWLGSLGATRWWLICPVSGLEGRFVPRLRAPRALVERNDTEPCVVWTTRW